MQMEPPVEIKYLHPLAEAAGLNYGTEMAAALDVIAAISEPLKLYPGQAVLVPTGFSMLINNPFVAAVLLPRSGNGHKRGLILGNGSGLLDADYTAEVMVSLWNRNFSGEPAIINPGERIAQMAFVPIIRPQLQKVTEFSTQTQRGSGGFGSTGA